VAFVWNTLGDLFGTETSRFLLLAQQAITDSLAEELVEIEVVSH